MKAWVIEGSRPLCGAIRAAGAKNAVLPMMAAAILSDRPVVLRRAPRLRDVRTMTGLLRRLGACVEHSGDELIVDAGRINGWSAPWAAVRRMRAGFCVLGPLLARFGRAVVPLPGGCRLGDRPVDLHLAGLRALGAQIEIQSGCVIAAARRLRGAEVMMSGRFGPSVTGTAQLLCTAVAAEGETTIRGAAREPEIVDLARLLSAMGAKIEGAGEATIRIEGVAGLGGAEHRVIADRIEAATFLFAAAVTGGDVLVEDADPAHLEAPLAALAAAGCRVEVRRSGIRLVGPSGAPAGFSGSARDENKSGGPTDLPGSVADVPRMGPIADLPDSAGDGKRMGAFARFPGSAGDGNRMGATAGLPGSAESAFEPAGGVVRNWAGGRLAPVSIGTRPYPGFPTDLQAPWTALMAVAAGRSRIVDEVFPQRFAHAAELRRLGAMIRVEGNAAEVVGPARLEGAPVRATDLRAGAALVLAALAARGRTTIFGVAHIERGYERLAEKLRSLGAQLAVESALPRNSVQIGLP